MSLASSPAPFPSEHHPVPDLSIELTSPTRTYDHLGQRIFFGTDQTVDCSVDLAGIPTEVTDVANERWLRVFLRFDRQLFDLHTDGNSQRVYFRRDESVVIRVEMASTAGSDEVRYDAGPAEEVIWGHTLSREWGESVNFV